jgi:hypothetical protein
MSNDAIFPAHIHSWGEFVYAHNGVVQVMVEKERYLVPPQYGILVPPNVEHVGMNRREVLQSSLYVANEMCSTLPSKPIALMVSPFMRSVLDHASESILDYKSQRKLRLLTVFLDELAETPRAGTFLPASDDPVLERIQHYFETHPKDNRSVAELAHDTKITERTLAREFGYSNASAFIAMFKKLTGATPASYRKNHD